MVKKRITFCFVAAFVLVFGLAACGGGGEEQKEEQQAQQATQQQEPTQQQKTQQEPTQQAAQGTLPTTQSSDLAAQLIGTWDATSIEGNPVPPGTQILTFSADSTAQFSSGVSPETTVTVQYSVLDNSRIQFTSPDGTSYVASYSLDGETLTLTGPQGEAVRYQRTG